MLVIVQTSATMASLKRTREPILYEIPEHLEKRLKIQRYADGSETIEFTPDTANELRRDLIQYINSNHHDLGSIAQAFFRFRSHPHLDPMKVFQHIPVEFGTVSLEAVIEVINMLNQMGHFDDVESYIIESNITAMLQLVFRRGLDTIVDSVLNLYDQFEIYTVRVAVHIYTRLQYCDETNPSFHRILHRVISWVYQQMSYQDKLFKFSTTPGFGKLIQFLVVNGYIDVFLDFVQIVTVYLKTTNQRLDDKWVQMQANILKLLTESDQSVLAKFVQMNSWNDYPYAFDELFLSLPVWVIYVVLQNHDINKKSIAVDRFIQTERSEIINKEYGLYELATGSIVHKKGRSNVTKLYKEIVTRIDAYLDAGVPKEIAIINLSYEFMILNPDNQELVDKWIRKLVDSRISKQSVGYGILYRPNEYNKKQWTEIKNGQWMIGKQPLFRSGFMDPYEFHCVYGRINNTDVNLTCRINIATLEEIERQHQILRRLHDLTSVKVVPKIYDMFIDPDDDNEVVSYVIIEWIEHTLHSFLSELSFRYDYETRIDIIEDIKNQIKAKCRALVQMGLNPSNISTRRLLVKKEPESKTVTVLFIQTKYMKAIEPLPKSDDIERLVREFTSGVIIELNQSRR